MFSASAVLGPLCDGLHSAAGVLHYRHPSLNLNLQLAAGGPAWGLQTCWWVPLLFGVAGVIIGVGVPVLDQLAAAASSQTPQQQQQQQQQQRQQRQLAPEWPAVLLCISLFVAQYWASGWLQHALLDGGASSSLASTAAASGTAAAAAAAAAAGAAAAASTWPVEDGVLLTAAVATWAAFDRTPQGALMAALTAACGPAVEVALINALHLYDYSAPQVLGVPTWIPWVYAAGSPAVGGLGRRVWATLREQRAGRPAQLG